MEKLCPCASVYLCAYEAHVYFYLHLGFLIGQFKVETASPKEFTAGGVCTIIQHVSEFHSLFECLEATIQPSPLLACLSLLLSLQ